MKSLVREYQAILVVSPELNEEALSKLQAQFAELVGKNQGQVVSTLPWGKRKLTYKLGRFSEGNYLQVRIQVPSLQVAELEKATRMLEPILRVMMVEGAEFAGDIRPVTEESEEREAPHGEFK